MKGEKSVSCGVATMRLLSKYDVDTVFGIPGVHTLDFFRDWENLDIHHVQARNEQGAGFMADGYARFTGKPGVALVISGPGVTNALTAVGQAWADSVPLLLISSETASHTHGKGFGALHEIPDQKAVTTPLTALSMRATTPADVPEMLAAAFDSFASQRPRPVHISIPIDVLAQPVEEIWETQPTSSPPNPDSADVETAVELLLKAQHPVLMVGGGATEASSGIIELVESLDLPVVASTAGKGIVPDSHPLSLNASTVRPEIRDWLSSRDLVLAIGTELAETDSFVEKMCLTENLIRVDIDPNKISDQYTSSLGIVADAKATVEAINALGGFSSVEGRRASLEKELADVRYAVEKNLTVSETKHLKLLAALQSGLPEETVFVGDICQLVYTGAFGIERNLPRTWGYPAGYCTLGCGLPNAIGAAFSLPEHTPIVCLAGDGGFMFTVQELIVAAEEGLGLPVIIWDNGGLKQIQDDMSAESIPLVGVTGRNPDFVKLAESMGCDGLIGQNLEHIVSETNAALKKDYPTVIVVRENETWLQ